MTPHSVGVGHDGLRPPLVVDAWIPAPPPGGRIPEVPGHEGLANAIRLPTAGVVCRTFLHPTIKVHNFKPWFESADIDPDGLGNETQRLCALEGDLPSAADEALYTGNWDDYTASPADVSVLSGLSTWINESQQSKDGSMEDFFKTDNSSGLPRMVERVAGIPPALDLQTNVRLLDFGCGSGRDVVSMQQYFGAAVEDTLCADIFRVDRDDVTPIVLDATDDVTYKTSLDEALLLSVNGTVHVAISMVTFHHIVPGMREDAFQFIRQALRPHGIFIMADWDNSVTPDLWIFYDLVHRFWALMTAEFSPDTEPSSLRLATNYSSIDTWMQELSNVGLRYDDNRTRATNQGHVGPRQVASLEGNAQRDFTAVWQKP